MTNWGIVALLVLPGCLWGVADVAQAQTARSHNSGPRPLPTAPNSARPIPASSSQPHSVLKWRASSKVTPVSAEEPLDEHNAQMSPVGHVHLAQADGRSVLTGRAQRGARSNDPFNDPFGDQLTNIQEEEADDQPAPLPRNRFSPPSFVPEESPSDQPESLLPEALDEPGVHSAPRLPGPSMLPPPSSQPQGGVPCDNIYNQRNCCEEEENCVAARAALDKFNIRRISVDISPAYRPDEEDPEVARELQTRELQASPSREWRGRDGQLIATGRLLDLKSRQVSIDTGSEIKRIPLHNLGSDEMCFVSAYWNTPFECAWGDLGVATRNWNPLEVNWTASALCHKPLYFEERALERYGHMTGPLSQPLVSGAHFFVSAALLPYKMGMNPPNECMYALGYYRPGNCAPYLVPPVPLSARGAAAQTGAIFGAIYLIP